MTDKSHDATMEQDDVVSQNRSKLKEFIACIASIGRDLSNVTAPPFILDTKSTVELPAFWAERPYLFVAPAEEKHPAKRALFVLRWFLSTVRNQQYGGRSVEEGIKKPLNAFLGELFIARGNDECGETVLVSEQVSHHPPVTACRVWNDARGVSAEGYTEQEITLGLDGSVHVDQKGYASLTVEKYEETYLIPLLDLKVKGVLSGKPYPELEGKYSINCTSGWKSTIEFGGKRGLFGLHNRRHSFDAQVYAPNQFDNPVFTVKGNWDSKFTIRDEVNNEDIETFDVAAAKTTPMLTEPLDKQDPWESRRAWRETREALERGDMQAAAEAKSKLEKGQREMRHFDKDGETWERLFFKAGMLEQVVYNLATEDGNGLEHGAQTPWTFKRSDWDEGIFKKPYHRPLGPDNMIAGIQTLENGDTVGGW